MEDKEFQARIREMVKKLGGPAAAEKVLGISKGMLGKYQRGDADPSRAKLWLMGKSAGVEMNWLIMGEGTPNRDEI